MASIQAAFLDHQTPIMSEAGDDTDTSIDQLVYCCLTTQSPVCAGIQNWVDSSNAADPDQQLSGLLIKDNRLMIHWLEGQRAATNKIWRKIQDDEHHHCVVLLRHEHGIQKRLFNSWQICNASRNEMRAVVRELRDSAAALAQGTDHLHAISTLSILLNQDFAPLYAHTRMQSVSEFDGHTARLHEARQA